MVWPGLDVLGPTNSNWVCKLVFTPLFGFIQLLKLRPDTPNSASPSWPPWGRMVSPCPSYGTPKYDQRTPAFRVNEGRSFQLSLKNTDTSFSWGSMTLRCWSR